MAIEKMSMINIVGSVEYIDEVSKEIILSGNLDIVSALNEIKESRFNLDITENNVESLAEMAKVHPISANKDYKESLKKLDIIQKSYKEEFEIKVEHIREEYTLDSLQDEVNSFYEKFLPLFQKSEDIKKEIDDIDKLLHNFTLIKDLDVRIEELDNMKYFNYYFGLLSKENRIKLKKNYENIPAIVLHEGSSGEGEVYLIIFPVDLEIETERILRSLSFKKLNISKDLKGTPEEIIDRLETEKTRNIDKLSQYEEELVKLKNDNKEIIEKDYSRFNLQKRINELKRLMVSTEYLFYLSGWIPTDEKKDFERRLKKFNNIIIHYQEDEDTNTSFSPPTKLKNNWLFAPFEYLINMYGTPSYGELDPTPFLAITYLIFFGAMFGDIGQGLVIMLGGIYLKSKHKGGEFGKLFIRVGISSMFFGFLYGSIFGFEEVIHALLIVPFENINLTLIASVIIGIFFIFVSYIYSIMNGFRLDEYKEALFGRNGVVGALFYALILFMILQSFLNITGIPLGIGVVILLVLMAVMVVREPLANILFNKRPLYEEDISSYYIESSFEIIETLLSMISNTLSFIRVGAFALTHVGLFMAFQVIADIIGNTTGSIIVLIIGNIVIIGLEGLIVGIQALRLEYYELFSKYYRGEGRAYRPFGMKEEVK